MQEVLRMCTVTSRRWLLLFCVARLAQCVTGNDHDTGSSHILQAYEQHSSSHHRVQHLRFLSFRYSCTVVFAPSLMEVWKAGCEPGRSLSVKSKGQLTRCHRQGRRFTGSGIAGNMGPNPRIQAPIVHLVRA